MSTGCKTAVFYINAKNRQEPVASKLVWTWFVMCTLFGKLITNIVMPCILMIMVIAIILSKETIQVRTIFTCTHLSRKIFTSNWLEWVKSTSLHPETSKHDTICRNDYILINMTLLWCGVMWRSLYGWLRFFKLYSCRVMRYIVYRG